MPSKQHPCFPAAGRPIELLGLKGPYILTMAATLIADFLLFVLVYCLGLAPILSILLAAAIGAAGWIISRSLSKLFGPHGLSKHLAARRQPKGLRLDNRHAFIHLLNNKQ